jgi:uncharacterized protein YjbI with pentapeptide repeats
VNHQIKSRYDDSVIFECEVPDGLESGLRTRHVLEKAVEARANLAGAYLAGAYLAGANLARANLEGAYLAGAYLARANLEGAYLAGANLARANLEGAYLAGANLARANLEGAYLAGAYLAGAKWRDGIVIQRAPLQLYGLLWTVTILDEHMQIGCELHTLADWASFEDARIVKMDRQALRFWRAHKDSLLALAAADGRVVQAKEIA